MFAYIFPIVCGAAVGAVLRWLCGLVLVSSAPFSIGTLAANWLGALLIGVLAELLTDPQWRLLWITGFLGSLTTFSGFSVEMVGLMQAQRWGMALMATCLHIFGSFGLTALGIKLAQIWK